MSTAARTFWAGLPATGARLLPWWPAACVVALLTVARSGIVVDDVFWQVRSGLDALSSRSLPRSESYSWTAAGHAWIPNSWGWNVLLAAAYRASESLGADGLVGVRAASALGCAALLGAATSWGARHGARPWPTALVLLAVGAVMSGWLTPRPQLATYLLLLAAVALTRPAVLATGWARWRTVAALGLVHVVWVNLHFAALTGPVVVAAAAVGAQATAWLADPDRRGTWARSAARVALAPAVAMAGCLLTPYGPQAPLKVTIVANTSVGVVAEWAPPGLGSTAQQSALALLIIGLAGLAAAVRMRDFATVGALVVLTAGTVTASRFAPMLATIALIPLMTWLSRPRPVEYLRSRRVPVAAAGAVVTVTVGLSAAMAPWVWSSGGSDPELVGQLPTGCRLLNDYRIGGEVELLRPDVPVAVDSRNDIYGPDLIRDVTRPLGGSADAVDWLDEHEVTCVLVDRDVHLVHTLAGTAGWRLADQSSTRALLVRTATP